MKRALLAAILSCLAIASARADLIWYEPFNYVDGPIAATGTNIDGSTNWFKHSGTADPSDARLANRKLQVSTTGGSLSRQDDVNRKLAVTPDSPYTNSSIVLYASFTINCTNLPTVTNYFAHFMVDTTFRARVFALPGTVAGTWRLGISGAAGSPSQVFPADLGANADYQVVLQWDPVNYYAATLWVNPLSSADPSVMSGDAVAPPPAVTAFGFRQSSSFGSAFFNITNLAVATTFEEAANAVWSPTPVAPVVVYQPKNITNFVGNPASLSILAAGQGLTGLTYQWRKNGVDITNPEGNSPTLNFFSLSTSDSGQYTVVVSNPTTGLSTASAVAFVVVNTQPVPPTITQQPTNTTVYFGQTAVLSVGASGAAPISYQWYYNNNLIAGAADATLTIANVQNNNGTTGTYRCDVTNPNGTTRSTNATLSAIAPPPMVKIGYLRTLVDPVFFLPTNTTTLYTVKGIVTTHTNVTTAANSSFYIQDETGGLDIFFGGNATARPQAGDEVTVTGPLGHYSGLLELNLSASDPAHSVVTNSSNNPLPAGVVLPFSFTNSTAFGGVGNAMRLYQGAVVTFTNVFFPDGFAGTNLFAGGKNYTITNQAGETFAFRVDARVGDIIGQPIPAFAWTVSGPMSYFLGNTVTDRSRGYQLMPTRYADIVTNAPAPVTATAALAGGKPTLTWLAQPYMSYSILRASDLSGPFLPLATGLTFNHTAGQFTDTNPVPATRFYKIVSP